VNKSFMLASAWRWHVENPSLSSKGENTMRLLTLLSTAVTAGLLITATAAIGDEDDRRGRLTELAERAVEQGEARRNGREARRDHDRSRHYRHVDNHRNSSHRDRYVRHHRSVYGGYGHERSRHQVRRHYRENDNLRIYISPYHVFSLNHHSRYYPAHVRYHMPSHFRFSSQPGRCHLVTDEEWYYDRIAVVTFEICYDRFGEAWRTRDSTRLRYYVD
jgi:hypothetical protein